MHARTAAEEMEQIVGITAQRGFSHATDSLLVQISIDPRHVPAAVFDHAKRTVHVAQSMGSELLFQTKGKQPGVVAADIDIAARERYFAVVVPAVH